MHAGALQGSQARSTCVAAAFTSGLSATPVRPMSGEPGGEVLLRRGQCIARRAQRIARMAELLGRYRTARGEVLAPVVVRLRPREVGAPLADHRLELVAVGEHGVRLAHGARQLLLGVLQRDARVGGIEPDQHLPGAHQVGLVGADRDHGAR